MANDPDARAENACVRGSAAAFTALSAHPTPRYTVHTLDTSDPEGTLRRYVIEHEVTCLCLCTIGAKGILAVAIWQLEETTLLLYDMNSSEAEPSLVFPLSHMGKFIHVLK